MAIKQPFDWPLEKLKAYRPPLTRPEDFDAFWARSKALLSEQPLDWQLQPVDYPARQVELFRLTFTGFQGARIAGWYARPASAGPHPGLVLYHAYNWSLDGRIHDIVNWALHGYATLGMLVRGQQDSEDNVGSPHGHYSGWMTKGVLDPERYYYRGVYMDAVRALDILAAMEEVDATRIGVTGGSQGGGLALAACALSDIPAVGMADYPFLCHFRRGVDVALNGPYLELVEFFRRNSDPAVEEQAFHTLAYFDVLNLAEWITCPVLVSIGLLDDITPPSTVFAAYNHIQSPKEIRVYRYFGHEYIPAFHMEKLRYLQRFLHRV